jgi:hypothetical protein
MRGESGHGGARQGKVWRGSFQWQETSMAEQATKANGRETKTRSEAGTREKIVRQVRIRGLTDIMFDRYPGDNDTKLEPWQKLYLGGETGRTVCLPSVNVMSFLSAQNTDSAPKRLLDSRKYKQFCFACGSFVTVGPRMIPFVRDDQPIVFGRIDGRTEDGLACDTSTGIYIKHDVARLEKGIPNPKVRPVLPMPWELAFTLTLLPNKTLQEQQLLNIFTEGLLCLGLGTFRGQYGKAEVVLWE